MKRGVSLTALGALFLLAYGAAADPPPCPPAAEVTGDSAEKIAPLLAARGVAASPPAGCPLTRARVTRNARGLAVALVTPDGRRSERLVSTAEVAATWIESWARGDLSDPLLAPARPSSLAFFITRGEVASPFRADAADAIEIEAYGQRLPKPKERLALTLGSELSLARGGALKYGTALGTDLRVGPLRIGLTGRLLRAGGAGLSSRPQALRGKSAPRGAANAQNDPNCPDANSDGVCDDPSGGGANGCADADNDGVPDDPGCINGCVDDNRDGVCDDPGGCVDANNDGACDAPDGGCENDPGCCVDANGDNLCDGQGGGQAGCADADGDGVVDDPTCAAASGGRYSLDLRGEVRAPLALGSFSVSPGLALGLDVGGASARRLRAEAGLVVSRPLTERLALDLRLSFDALPPGEESRQVRGGLGLRFAGR
jgi:hypothetical protein